MSKYEDDEIQRLMRSLQHNQNPRSSSQWGFWHIMGAVVIILVLAFSIVWVVSQLQPNPPATTVVEPNGAQFMEQLGAIETVMGSFGNENDHPVEQTPTPDTNSGASTPLPESDEPNATRAAAAVLDHLALVTAQAEQSLGLTQDVNQVEVVIPDVDTEAMKKLYADDLAVNVAGGHLQNFTVIYSLFIDASMLIDVTNRPTVSNDAPIIAATQKVARFAEASPISAFPFTLVTMDFPDDNNGKTVIQRDMQGILHVGILNKQFNVTPFYIAPDGTRLYTHEQIREWAQKWASDQEEKGNNISQPILLGAGARVNISNITLCRLKETKIGLGTDVATTSQPEGSMLNYLALRPMLNAIAQNLITGPAQPDIQALSDAYTLAERRFYNAMSDSELLALGSEQARIALSGPHDGVPAGHVYQQLEAEYGALVGGNIELVTGDIIDPSPAVDCTTGQPFEMWDIPTTD